MEIYVKQNEKNYSYKQNELFIKSYFEKSSSFSVVMFDIHDMGKRNSFVPWIEIFSRGCTGS